MQSISADLENALQQGAMTVRPLVVMHLSNNRVRNPTVTTNNPLNERVLVDGYYTPSMRFAVTDSRYRTDDWARTWPIENQDSQVPWVSSTNPPVTVTVDYGKLVTCNKLVVSTDPFVFRATSVTLEIDKGSGFQTVISNYSPPTYLTEIYLQSADGNSWGPTVNRSYTTQIRAVRATINSVANPGKPQVYEVDAAVEKDVSDDVISWSVTKERDLSSVTVSPVGMSNANSANIVLDNSSNLYNNENTLSPYAGMLYPNVRFDISVGFRKADQTYEYVRQGIFYADTWEISSDTTQVTVSCRDFSKILQDKRTPQLFYHDWLIHDIVRDIAERAGILDMDIDTSRLSRDDLSPNPNPIADITNIEDIVCIPRRNTVWSDEENTYWQFLQQVALADLGVFYFDENGKFKFRVKDSLIDPSHPEMGIVMQLEQNLHLISARHLTELMRNDFTIEYTIPKLTKDTVGLWEADNPTILDATTLGGSIGAKSKTIPAGDISDWPLEGYIKIDDEVIKYNDRSDSAFLECERGVLRTTPSSHAGGTTIYEVRKFDVEYSQSPATEIAILNTNEVYTELLAANLGPFGAELYLQNTYAGKVIVEGTHVEKALDGLPEFLILYGRAIDDEETQTVTRIDEVSIRKYGHQQLSISIPWAQSEVHAKSLVEFLVKAYSTPVTFIEAEVFAIPHLQIGDTVSINYPRLGHFAGRRFHVVGITISQNQGSFTQTIRLRSRAGEQAVTDPTFIVWHGVDAYLKKTIQKSVWNAVDAVIALRTVRYLADALRKKRTSVVHSVDALRSKPTLSYFVDAIIPAKVKVGQRVDAYIRGSGYVWSNMNSLARKTSSASHSMDALIS